jgi:hypothetical protein
MDLEDDPMSLMIWRRGNGANLKGGTKGFDGLLRVRMHHCLRQRLKIGWLNHFLSSD